MEMLANLASAERADRYVWPVESSVVPLRKADITLGVLREIVETGHDDPHTLIEKLTAMERDYQRGKPELARAHADGVLRLTENPCLILLARTNHMLASVALGDAETAYGDLKELYWRCQEGLEHTEDGIWLGLSLLCGLRAEALLAAIIFDDEQIRDAVDSIYCPFKGMLGHLLALRELRNGHAQLAKGMLYVYSINADKTDLVLQITLNALLSSVYTIGGMREEALKHFSIAWDLKCESDFIMPLVSLNYFTFGTQRCLGLTNGSDECRRMEEAVRRYNKGWFALRGLCGLHTPLESLTLLECYTLALAVVGWRNKEMASFLKISINTVKHQLTSAYQKIGASNRGEAHHIVSASFATKLSAKAFRGRA